MSLYKGKPDQRWVSYAQISPYIKEAVVFAEDGNFFSHGGVDFRALWEATKINLKRKKLKFGGSTITQQLAKNLYLSPSRNPFRKFREVMIAWKLEQVLSKQRILELYLNVAEWGVGIYGVEAASRHYFGRTAASLGPEQAAWLASILPRPRYYDRRGITPHIDRKMGRVLRKID